MTVSAYAVRQSGCLLLLYGVFVYDILIKLDCEHGEGTCSSGTGLRSGPILPSGEWTGDDTALPEGDR